MISPLLPLWRRGAFRLQLSGLSSPPMGSLKTFRGGRTRRSREPLQIAGKTRHLDLQWGEARGRACFIVIIGLESPPCLIGMDIMRPLRFRIDVTNGTATPAQPNPQTIHLNAAQQQVLSPPVTSRALLLQTTDIPAETARLILCHNPWPSEDVYFSPEDALLAFVTGGPRTFQRLRGVDSRLQPPPRASPPVLGSECRHLGSGYRHGRQIATPQARICVSATHTGALITAPTAAAERPL